MNVRACAVVGQCNAHYEEMALPRFVLFSYNQSATNLLSFISFCICQYFFLRIHSRRCINHIEEKPRRLIQHQKDYNPTHPTRYIAEQQTTHPLQVR
jgi:hypothetical protein